MLARSSGIFGQGRAAKTATSSAQESPVYLGPSRVSSYERCARAYWFQYELKAQSDEDGVALLFGSAIDRAVDGYLQALDSGRSFDGEASFEAHWQTAIDSSIVKLNKTWTEPELRAAGKMLMARFPGAWESSGLTALSGPDGKLLTQVDVTGFDIGHNVKLRLKPDLFAASVQGDVEVVDVKTAAQVATIEFSENSDQLVMYQIIGDAKASDLGFDRVDAMRFFEGVKKKVPKKKGEGPSWHVGERIERKSDAVVHELKTKLYDIASDIRRGRFPKEPGMAFDSPCKMCSFSKACTGVGWDGLTIPDDRVHRLAEMPTLSVYSPP